MLAVVANAGGAANIKYVHSNHLYSPAALTDNTGAVVERYKYDAYGKRTIYDAAGTVVRTASSYGFPVCFTGRYEDKETGLLYFRARYYSASQGRFVGRDPLPSFQALINAMIGMEMFGERHDGYNLYAGYYIPSGTDPSGMIVVSPECRQKCADSLPDYGGYRPFGFINPPIDYVRRYQDCLKKCPRQELNADGSSTYYVNKCEIIILHEHGDAARPHTFVFEDDKCSAAVHAGCGAGATNENIPAGNRVQTAGGNDYLCTNKDKTFTGGAADEGDFFRNVASRGGNADKKADAMCKSCKCCKTVTVKFIGSLPKPPLDGSNFGASGFNSQYDAVRTKDCASGSWTYGK